MSNKQVRYKPGPHVCLPISWSMTAILRDSAVVVVVRTRPRAIPLAMITMRKLMHGFPSLSYMGMVLRYKTIQPVYYGQHGLLHGSPMTKNNDVAQGGGHTPATALDYKISMLCSIGSCLNKVSAD